MHERRKRIEKIFLGVSLAGALYVLTELVLQIFGASICHTEGCKVVAQYARFGDVSMLLIGLLLFAGLAALAALNLDSGREGFAKYINLIVITALASEGYFTGYQAFSIHAPCLFCLTVFGLLVVLGLLRLFSGEREIIAGFAAMAAVFSLMYLVLPAGGAAHIPDDGQFVLFYSKECKYCAQVIKEIDDNKIPVKHVLVTEYSAFLKGMGIDHVPTLYVNKGYEKTFLTGKDAIESYLHCKAQEGARPETSPTGTTAAARKADPKAEKSGAGKAENLLNAGGKTFEVIQPSSEDGMCKENEECK